MKDTKPIRPSEELNAENLKAFLHENLNIGAPYGAGIQ
jgi:hypothetical protein